MFEVGWTEMLVIAVVMIVVVGPKDLPKMLRAFGRTTAKLRSMASDFQKQFDEALKEAELDDVKKSVDELRRLNPTAEIRKQLNPFEKAAADVRAGLDQAMKPKPAAQDTVPAADEAAKPAEPLKNGATDMPAAALAEPASSPASAEAAPVAAPAAKAGRAKPAAGPGKGTAKASAAGKTSAKPATKAAAPAAKAKAATPAKPAAAAAKPAAKAKAAAPAKPAAGAGKAAPVARPARTKAAEAKKTTARAGK